MRITLLILCIGAISAAPSTFNHRIVGGSLTSITNYPDIAALLITQNWVDFVQDCGGSILNQRNILTAAHCLVFFDTPMRWRIRVGSSFANSGGTVHNIAQIISHPDYNHSTLDSDIAILRTYTLINYLDNLVQPGAIAGSNYNLADNQVVWAAGWGITEYGTPSEQLRHVQIWTINQQICNQRYMGFITENMLCSGWLDVGGRDQCTGDSGGPLYHNRVIVGVCSFGTPDCGSATFPGVNARVSRFTNWIVANAV